MRPNELPMILSKPGATMTLTHRYAALAAVLGCVLLLQMATGAEPLTNPSATAAVLSTRAEFVSGGDALIGVDVPAGIAATAVSVRLNDKDVTSSFKRDASGKSLLGLVKGLRVGPNT